METMTFGADDVDAKWLLDSALTARSCVDNLVASVSPLVQVSRNNHSLNRSTRESKPENILQVVQQMTKLILPNPKIPVSRYPPQNWDIFSNKIESGEIRFVAESENGVEVKLQDKFASTKVEQTRYSIARSLQLTDKALSNDVAYKLSQMIMIHGAEVLKETPDWCFNAVSQTINNIFTKAELERIKIEAPTWNRKVIRIRNTVQKWDSGYGTGYQIIIRGRIKLFEITDADPVLRGHFICTQVTSCPIGDKTEGVGYLPLSEAPNVSKDVLGNLNTTSIVWNDLDEVDEQWEDCVMGDDNDSGPESAPRNNEKGVNTPLTSTTISEMLCWGDNEHSELSDSAQSLITNISPLKWQPLTSWENVRTVSTSSSHTILATSRGLVYTCGDGSEGALGHGDLERAGSFRPVTWFSELEDIPHISSVGAGGDLFGSHSIALDTQGRVYTWGLGSACGRGSRKPLPEPGLVDLTSNISQIDCGGGYCVALSKRGDLFTWGNWAGGRLGLGPVPSKVDVSYLHGRSRKKLFSLLLHPKQVNTSGVRLDAVSCGDAHTAAITASGALLVWGQNDSGQLGLGHSVETNHLEPVFQPTMIPQFHGGDQQHSVTFVACGASHTLVIDAVREVWTFGALGAACLGLGGDHLNGRLRHTFRSTSELQAARAVRQRSVSSTTETPSWSLPTKCVALSGCGARSASLGERHTVVLLECGRVMMCGDGVAMAHHLASKGKGITSQELLAKLDNDEPVSIMRRPCASWFPMLEGKYIASVCCGGQHTIVLSKGEYVGLTLGQDLLQAARRSASKRRKDMESEEESERAWNELDVLSEGCDCVMITSGSVLPAHRIVLAKRSKVLCDLILEEERPGRPGVLELLLPELRHDTALALREYLYTDSVSYPLEPGYSLPNELMKAAELYDLPRLHALCLNAIPESKNNSKELLPPSDLATHFGNALGDSTWADVKLIADEKTIHAHSTILMTASEYFTKMFRFGLSEEDQINAFSTTKAPLEIVVPDSYVSVLRMLLWIYTGYIDSAEDSILLEDLLVADRFQLLEMKRTCESLIDVNASNCVSALGVAHMVNAHRLKEEALAVLCHSLHHSEVRVDAIELVKQHPDLSELIFRALSDQCASRTRDKHHVASESRKETTEDEKLVQQHGVFPVTSLLLSLLFALIYAYSSRFVVLGPLVPIINSVGLIGLIYWGMRTARS